MILANMLIGFIVGVVVGYLMSIRTLDLMYKIAMRRADKEVHSQYRRILRESGIDCDIK